MSKLFLGLDLSIGQVRPDLFMGTACGFEVPKPMSGGLYCASPKFSDFDHEPNLCFMFFLDF